MNVLENLTEATEILNEVDTYKNSLVDKLSEQDKKLQDLGHYIETHSLSAPQCCRIIKEIKKQREIRRKIKNDISLFAVYDRHSNKMLNMDNRKMLLTELYKTEKKLHTEYKNRIYTDEELKELIGG